MLEGKKVTQGNSSLCCVIVLPESLHLQYSFSFVFPVTVMLLSVDSLCIAEILRNPQPLGFRQQNSDFLVTPVRESTIFIVINISLKI